MEQNRKIIYWVVFLSSLPFALTHYINSSFLTAAVGEKFVGILYTLGSIGSLAVLALAPKYFKKFGGYKFLIYVTLLDALYFLLIGYIQNAFLVALIFILGFSLNILIAFSLDEFLKIFSKNSSLGRVRGITLVVTHVAFIMTQVAFWFSLGEHSFRNIYQIGALLTFSLAFLAALGLRNVPEPEYDQVRKITFVAEFFHNKKLLHAYVINFLLQLFYAWMIIYTPIYLSVHLGFNWSQIGMMFAIMLLPFLFIPFHIGKYIDKYGERKTLMAGFLIAGIATTLIFFQGSGSGIIAWAILLLLTRIGAAIIEVSSDAYFFKHIEPENDQYIGVYRSTAPISYIIGPLFASGIFYFFPDFNFIYFFLSAFMLYGVYLASTIQKSDI